MTVEMLGWRSVSVELDKSPFHLSVCLYLSSAYCFLVVVSSH